MTAPSVTEGTGTPGSADVAGSSLSLGLTGVTDIQWLTLRLSPIEDVAGNVLDLAYTLDIPAGDVTRNGTVNAQDMLCVRYYSLHALLERLV